MARRAVAGDTSRSEIKPIGKLRQLLRRLVIRGPRRVETVGAIELARVKDQSSVLRGEHMLRRVARENGDGILVPGFWVLTGARRQSERDKW